MNERLGCVGGSVGERSRFLAIPGLEWHYRPGSCVPLLVYRVPVQVDLWSARTLFLSTAGVKRASRAIR